MTQLPSGETSQALDLGLSEALEQPRTATIAVDDVDPRPLALVDPAEDDALAVRGPPRRVGVTLKQRHPPFAHVKQVDAGLARVAADECDRAPVRRPGGTV